MFLGFESESGETINVELPLESVSVQRELGAGIRLFAYAYSPAEGLQGGDFGELARRASRGRIVGVVRDPGGREFDCPKGTITGVELLASTGRPGETGNQSHRIQIRMAGGVRPDANRQADATARWRVLRGETLQALAAKCSSAARLDRSLELILSRVRVGAPPDSDAVLIQAGVSDRELLRRLLTHSQWTQTRVPTWWPLVFTGVVNDRCESTWSVQSVSKRAHVNGRTFEGRRVRTEEMSGRYSTYLGRRVNEDSPEGEGEVACVAHRWDARAYDADAWKRWRGA